jgi:hypothetical protein
MTTMSVDDFNAWEKTARSGESVVYFQGYLAYARGGEKKNPEQLKLSKMADRAYEAHDEGRVHLIQKRVSDYSWNYIAVKSISIFN